MKFLATPLSVIYALGWVTVFGLQLPVWKIYSQYTTQPAGHPFVGRCNEYQPKGGDALRMGSKGRYGS